jgi:polyisoprenoid-binding protein YceI
MGTRYRLGPDHSRFTVQGFAAGMLSFLAHSPTFAVRDFVGAANFEGDQIERMGLGLVINAASLQLLDEVRAADRQEIEGRMRREVLEIARYPEITYQAAPASVTPVGAGRYRLRLEGTLSLHGVSRPFPAEVELQVLTDGIRLHGEWPLRMSDHGLAPVTALGGAIKLRDELKVSADLAGFLEEA